VLGDDVEAARPEKAQRRLVQLLRIRRHHGDVAHAEVRERADRGADAGGGRQPGRVLDLLDEHVLEPLAARGHDRHSGMNDVVHVTRGEIAHRGHDRVEHVLLEVVAAPMLDVGGGGAHGHAVGSEPVEIIGRGLDHGGAEQADALAPAEGAVGIAHRSMLDCARCEMDEDVRDSSSLMALPSAGNETVGCPQRGERIATGEHEAANAGLRERGLERAGPAGE
jgi:hypothetical protein